MSFEGFFHHLPWPVHGVLVLIACYAYYLVTDFYLVPVVSKISKHFHIPDDVAGATLLGACLNAPELISHVLGMVAGSEVGLGLVMGSFNFNLLMICGGTALLAPKGLQLVLEWRYVQRDFFFYALSLVEIMWFCSDSILTRLEAIILFSTYIIYVLVCAFTGKIARLLCDPAKRKHRRRRGMTKGVLDRACEDGANCSPEAISAAAGSFLRAVSERRSSLGLRGDSIPVLAQGEQVPPPQLEGADIRRVTSDVQPSEPPRSFGIKPFNASGLGAPSPSSASAAIIITHPSQRGGRYGSIDSLGAVAPSKSKWDNDKHYQALRPLLELSRLSDDGRRLSVAGSASAVPPALSGLGGPLASPKAALRTGSPRYQLTPSAAADIQVPLTTPAVDKAPANWQQGDSTALDVGLLTGCADADEDIDLRLLTGLRVDRFDDQHSIVSFEDAENLEILKAAQEAAAVHAPDPDSLVEWPRDGSALSKVVAVCMFPLHGAVWLTIPPPRAVGQPCHWACSAVTCLVCCIWLGLIASWMQTCAHLAGRGIGISDELVGLTIGACGTSLPNAFAAISAGTTGYIETAVCQALGSNTFDSLVAFALPYIVKIAVTGKSQRIQAEGVGFDGVVDLSILVVWGLLLGLWGMRLDKTLGVIFVGMYAAWTGVYIALRAGGDSGDQVAIA